MHSEIIIRINKVIDHIEKHLSNELTLDKLAQIANLSKFHFHRTFKLITRETPNEYIIRKRIEKIASLLMVGVDTSISDLSATYGFQNLSSFSRSFRKQYGCSATQFKKGVRSREETGNLRNSKIGKISALSQNYLYASEKLKDWMAEKAEIAVKFLPEVQVAYVRHWGSPYTIDKAFDKLQKWCKTNDPWRLGENYFILFHDNPTLTDDYKIQQSACIEIKNQDFTKPGISVLSIPSQKYVLGKFSVTDGEFEMAWNSMVLWINEHNLNVKDGHRFEKFLENSLFDSSPVYQIEIGIPI